MHEMHSLDALAANGIVDFDSQAFVFGTKAKYAGKPYEVHLPFEEPLPAFPKHLPVGTGMHAQPMHDEFKTHDNHKEHGGTPAWKKWLAAGLAVAGIILVGTKFKSKIKPALKKLGSLIVAPFKYIKNKIFKQKGTGATSAKTGTTPPTGGTATPPAGTAPAAGTTPPAATVTP